MADFMDAVRGAFDPISNWRYGMGANEKARIGGSGELPGSPAAGAADTQPGERYAAGYLFAKQHPIIARGGQRVADYMHGLMPYAFEDFGDAVPNDVRHSYATAGMNRALLDRENEQRAASTQAAALEPQQPTTPTPQPAPRPQIAMQQFPR